MIEAHVKIFLDAADAKQCWIIVRPMNRPSEFYLTATNCEAKPLSCKAKTANNPDHPLAGLVVSPELVREAFRPQSLDKALASWEQFEYKLADGESSGYALVRDGDFRGCVTYGGRYLHADYDLLAVIPLDSSHQPVFGSPQSIPRRIPTAGGEIDHMSDLAAEVMAFFNSRVARPMVRHGADFDDLDDFRPGAEMCDWFGPRRRYEKKFYFGMSTAVH